ncbi:MAG: adenylyltransferase/cytidyltransferase family protein [Thermoplasmatota archaeon]
MNLVIGRFQPLHKGHVALIEEAMRDGPSVIGVGSSQESRTERNPFTFEEREAFIHAVFPDAEVVAVPDINDPPNWVAHVQSLVTFDKVFGNDASTLHLFQDAGIPVQRPGLQERAQWEGSAIRIWVDWENRVPPQVVPLVHTFRQRW